MSDVGVVRRCLVLSGVVMLGRFTMMMSSMSVMFGGFGVMF